MSPWVSKYCHFRTVEIQKETKKEKKKQQLEFHQLSKSRIKFPKGPSNVILRKKGNSSHHNKHQILQAREPFLVSCVPSLRNFIVKLRKKPAFL